MKLEIEITEEEIRSAVERKINDRLAKLRSGIEGLETGNTNCGTRNPHLI